MKKTVLPFILFVITFSISSCDSDKCGCTYPAELNFLKSWRLIYTDVNGKQVPSDNKEIITFDSFNKRIPVYKKEIDDVVVEQTVVDAIKETSDRDEVVVTMTLDNIAYKQKLKLVYIAGQTQTLVATPKVKASENFGNYILHYELYQP